MSFYLSYLMGGEEIADGDLESLGIAISGKTKDGHRKLNIPGKRLGQYVSLVKDKLSNDFWNEVVGANEIIFIFKFKDGHIQQYNLSQETEKQIDALCAEFNQETPNEVANVYKWLSENDHYHDLMLEHYSRWINR